VDFLIRSAPGLHLSKLIFKFVKRDAEIRTMRLPNVSRASSHNLIECYADRDHGFRSFWCKSRLCTRAESVARAGGVPQLFRQQLYAQRISAVSK
jgi:hypothetical protein